MMAPLIPIFFAEGFIFLLKLLDCIEDELVAILGVVGLYAMSLVVAISCSANRKGSEE